MGAAHPTLPAGEPSLSNAMARLASATQDMIVRRIELMMLEHKALVSGWIVEATLGLLGAATGLAAWFSAAAALVLYAVPELGFVGQLAIFASINAAATVVVISNVRRMKSAAGPDARTVRAIPIADTSRAMHEPGELHVE